MAFRAPWTAVARARSRCFSTSTCLHKNKVSALEFQLSTKDAVYRARLAALEQLLPSIKGRWGGVSFAVMQALGLGWLTDSEESLMRFVRARATYVPRWVIDAICHVPCRGEQGTAKASFITTNSTLPGNGWRPLDTLPLSPPPPRTSSSPPPSQAIITPHDEPMTYTAFSPERHLHPDVDIPDGVSVIPFNLSPMSLLALGPSADLSTSMINMISKDPIWYTDKRFTILPGVEVQLATVNTNEPETDRAMLRMNFDKIDVDMLACYPVLLPIHLIEFQYDAHGQQDLRATVALGAWDPYLITYALRTEDPDVWRSKLTPSFLDLDMVDFDPRVPVAPSVLDPLAKDEAEAADIRIIDFLTKQSHLKGAFEQHAKMCLEKADWSACEAWERQHADADSHEARSGVGRHIEWSSTHIRPYYEDMEVNRRYAALSSEEALWTHLYKGVENDRSRGVDVSRVEMLQDGESVTGEEAIELIRKRLAEAQVKRLASKPDWLRERT